MQVTKLTVETHLTGLFAFSQRCAQGGVWKSELIEDGGDRHGRRAPGRGRLMVGE